MILTDNEKRMLDGQFGSGTQMAMKLLKTWGEAFDARRMVKANIVHISTNVPTDLLEAMTAGVSRVRTSCSLHAVFNPRDWREKFGIVPPKGLAIGAATSDEADMDKRLGILARIGAYPTFSCVPYAIGFVPRQGDVFLGTGSSGQIITNSIFAARAGRESAATALAAAITGVTPEMGLLKKENRFAELVFDVEGLDVSAFTNADFGALGYYMGGVAGIRNIAIRGLPTTLAMEQCKFILSPLPVSGACTICHIVGLTPEAPTLEAALGGKKPKEVLKVGEKEIQKAREMVSNATDRNVDMVMFGCPHLLLSELRELAGLLDGKRINGNTKLVLGVTNATYSIAREAGYAAILEKAGAVVTNDCVSANNPFLYIGKGAPVVATDSSRGAHYMQRMTAGRSKTWYGSMKECVEAAVTGKWGGK